MSSVNSAYEYDSSTQWKLWRAYWGEEAKVVVDAHVYIKRDGFYYSTGTNSKRSIDWGRDVSGHAYHAEENDGAGYSYSHYGGKGRAMARRSDNKSLKKAQPAHDEGVNQAIIFVAEEDGVQVVSGSESEPCRPRLDDSPWSFYSGVMSVGGLAVPSICSGVGTRMLMLLSSFARRATSLLSSISVRRTRFCTTPPT
jgi:hypothetical protein